VVILALDTSSGRGSAAVIRTGGDHTLVIESAGDVARSHTERLPADLMAVLRAAGTTLDAVDRLAVIVGPGSFTGLRVGIATIQGLALARTLPVTPVSTFEALAWAARGGSSTDAIATWVDAHRGEVFATLFAPDGRTVLAPATALQPAATLDAWRDLLAPFRTRDEGTRDRYRVRFVGDGAVRYRDVIRERLREQAAIDDVAAMLASACGWIALEEPERAVRPHALVPLYVRRPDVELARDRRAASNP
jgi:tRNA threonylcarbamoyladenosine biosynthesis protein TsaB